jgi:hypothetical protein
VINRAVLYYLVNLLKLIRYKREINRTMNGEFREEIEVILYKREIYKLDKLITIEELDHLTNK